MHPAGLAHRARGRLP